MTRFVALAAAGTLAYAGNAGYYNTKYRIPGLQGIFMPARVEEALRIPKLDLDNNLEPADDYEYYNEDEYEQTANDTDEYLPGFWNGVPCEELLCADLPCNLIDELCDECGDDAACHEACGTEPPPSDTCPEPSDLVEAIPCTEDACQLHCPLDCDSCPHMEACKDQDPCDLDPCLESCPLDCEFCPERDGCAKEEGPAEECPDPLPEAEEAAPCNSPDGDSCEFEEEAEPEEECTGEDDSPCAGAVTEEVVVETEQNPCDLDPCSDSCPLKCVICPQAESCPDEDENAVEEVLTPEEAVDEGEEECEDPMTGADVATVAITEPVAAPTAAATEPVPEPTAAVTEAATTKAATTTKPVTAAPEPTTAVEIEPTVAATEAVTNNPELPGMNETETESMVVIAEPEGTEETLPETELPDYSNTVATEGLPATKIVQLETEPPMDLKIVEVEPTAPSDEVEVEEADVDVVTAEAVSEEDEEMGEECDAGGDDDYDDDEDEDVCDPTCCNEEDGSIYWFNNEPELDDDDLM